MRSPGHRISVALGKGDIDKLRSRTRKNLKWLIARIEVVQRDGSPDHTTTSDLLRRWATLVVRDRERPAIRIIGRSASTRRRQICRTSPADARRRYYWELGQIKIARPGARCPRNRGKVINPNRNCIIVRIVVGQMNLPTTHCQRSDGLDARRTNQRQRWNVPRRHRCVGRDDNIPDVINAVVNPRTLIASRHNRLRRRRVDSHPTELRARANGNPGTEVPPENLLRLTRRTIHRIKTLEINGRE